VNKQICTECRRAYDVSAEERRRRGAAAETLCPRCQVAAAHDAWSDGALPLRGRAAA
jgi:hypothetical protein